MAKRKTVRAAASAKASGTLPNEITWQQERFVEAYCDSGNATQSYLKVYKCAQHSAEVCGPRLLDKAGIQDAIAARRLEIQEAANYNLEKHLRILTGIMGATLDDFTEVMKNPRDKRNYRGLGDKRYALQESREIPTEHGIRKEVKLESKGWAARELQTIFGFNKKLDKRDESVDDDSILDSVRRIQNSKKET